MTYQPRKTIGRKVREARVARGLSQEQFGLELGYHRTYVGSLERGERNLSLDSALVLADRLGLHLLELLEPDEEDDGAPFKRAARRRS